MGTGAVRQWFFGSRRQPVRPDLGRPAALVGTSPGAQQDPPSHNANCEKGEADMADDLITPGTLSKEELKALYDAALMDTSYDSDGDLRIRDGISCCVFPRVDRIRLLALFRFKPTSSPQQRLDLVNRINSEYIIARATTLGDNGTGRLCFDYDIPVSGGIPKKTVVLVTKRFLSIPGPAVRDLDTADIVQ